MGYRQVMSLPFRNGELVTHRVVEINTDEKTYTTKGDANQAPCDIGIITV